MRHCYHYVREENIVSHLKKSPAQCSFKAAKVKDLFPLWGSLGLDGFYTVKVKDFIPADNESHCLMHNLSM